MIAPTFMTLPLEIRLHIYDYVLSSHYRLIPPYQDSALIYLNLKEDFPTALLRVNNKVYQEALPSFYSLNHFHLWCPPIDLSSESQQNNNNTTTSPPTKLPNTILTRPLLPFTSHQLLFLRRLSLQIAIYDTWSNFPSPTYTTPYEEATTIDPLVHTVNILAAAQTTLAVLALTLRRGSFMPKTVESEEPCQILRYVDPDGQLQAAVKKLSGLVRVEIWKERFPGPCPLPCPISKIRWVGAGAEALEEARALGWQGARAIEYGRMCYGRRAVGFFVAKGIGIILQKGRKVGPILMPSAAIYEDGRYLFLHNYPLELVRDVNRDWVP